MKCSWCKGAVSGPPEVRDKRAGRDVFHLICWERWNRSNRRDLAGPKKNVPTAVESPVLAGAIHGALVGAAVGAILGALSPTTAFGFTLPAPEPPALPEKGT